jgi:hypothetical protein
MSIEVTGPDGAIHEFPDDTSTDVIKRAMAKHYGSQAARQADPYAAFSSPVPQAANPMMPWEEYDYGAFGHTDCHWGSRDSRVHLSYQDYVAATAKGHTGHFSRTAKNLCRRIGGGL